MDLPTNIEFIIKGSVIKIRLMYWKNNIVYSLGDFQIVCAQRLVKSWHPWIQHPKDAPVMKFLAFNTNTDILYQFLILKPSQFSIP